MLKRMGWVGVLLVLFYGCRTADLQGLDKLKQDAETGDAQAQYELGHADETGDGVQTNLPGAVEWYTRSAEQGCADAQYRLGRCYRKGVGVETNILVAITWLEKAVSQNHPKAQNTLGYCYEKGQGVETNHTEALRLYHLSAEQDDEVAQCNLGQCYRVGRGVETNLVEAVKWYRLSAEQGYAKAQHLLGWRHLKGEGVEKNPEVAVEWFLKAAAQDYVDSMITLSFRYKKGDGVKKDLDEANHWYDRAVGLGYSGTVERPLPDYASMFITLDSKIREIETADPGSTNYLYWMHEAIECKTNLEQQKEIYPWLEELSINYSNHWKTLHAVAMGYCYALLNSYDDEVYERNRWQALRRMDRACCLLLDQSSFEARSGRFFEDYISILVGGRERDSHKLTIKTIDLSLEEVGGKEPTRVLVFFDYPESYDAAVNDGELIRWLLEQNRSGVSTGWFGEWGLADFAVLLAGTHRGLPRWERNRLKDWERTCPAEVKEILFGLADDETVVWEWTWESRKHSIQKLPPDYAYIPIYERRAELGDGDAIKILAELFKNRCQLGRAAHYFELDDDTNMVHSIRANQGSMVECKAQSVGKTPRIDYTYRNGNEVEFSIFRINVGINLLERFQNQEVMYSELSLLEGDPYWYLRKGMLEQPGIADELVVSWNVPLEPLPDHRDTTTEISIPPLPAGNYLVHAQMKGGNQAETILNIYDATLSYAFTETNHVNFVMLHDALTGKPLPNEPLVFMSLSGGKYLEEDCARIIDQKFEGKTNEEGLYVFPDEMTNGSWRVLARADQRTPLVASCASYDEYKRSYSPVDPENLWGGRYWWHGDQFTGREEKSYDVALDRSANKGIPADQSKRELCCWLEKAFFEQGDEIYCHVDFAGESDG
ncbi:MAG: hypothetical protein DRP64_17360, partial [Verrucomicrobia bacterium]